MARSARWLREWYEPHSSDLRRRRTRSATSSSSNALAPVPRARAVRHRADARSAAGVSDAAGQPLLDEDYLVLSTIHSAKGQEWDTVYLLNVVDGSFRPNSPPAGPITSRKSGACLYVAMTRAKNDLQLITPLKFTLTQQAAPAMRTFTARAAAS